MKFAAPIAVVVSIVAALLCLLAGSAMANLAGIGLLIAAAVLVAGIGVCSRLDELIALGTFRAARDADGTKPDTRTR